MAEEGIVDLPNINSQPPIHPSHFPTQSEPPKAGDVAIEYVLQSCSSINGHRQENVTMSTAENESDEVQFVFSVPRRKKKKRKRVRSTSKPPSIMRGSEMSTSPPNSRPTSISASSHTIHRGSTGTAQQLETYNMSGKTPSSAKSESLPTIERTLQPDLVNSRFVASPSSEMLLQDSATLPFAEALPWWNIQTPLTQKIGSFQFDICGMPFAEEVLKKRKYDDGPGNLVIEHGSLQSPQNKRVATQNNISPEPASKALTRLNEEPSRANAKPDSQSPAITAETQRISELAFPSGLPNSFSRPRNAASIARGVGPINTLERQPPQQPWQGSSTGQQYHDECVQQQIIEVPVSLVPELSVSPRTKTVQAQLQNIPSKASVTPRTTPLLVPPFEQSSAIVNTPLINLSGHSTGSNIPHLIRNGFPFLQSAPSDVQRKPSLYKIPPWPSPLKPSHIPLYTSDMDSDNRKEFSKSSCKRIQLSATQSANQSAGVDTTNTKRPLLEEILVKPYIPAKVASVPKNNDNREIPNTVLDTGHLRTTVSTRQVSPKPTITSFSNRIIDQTSPPTRKHTPNLIVDIAETCQEYFPFAAVAQRHKQPIQKVFDTFSAIIQLPLLRSAADNRRHGDLAKTRMKDFRDAKKAMERAQELERKKVSREVGKAECGDLALQKTSKKAPGLLKAAILNNARGKEGELES